MDRYTLEQTLNQVDELLRHGSPSCIRQARSIMVENFDAILRFALELTEPKPKPKHTIADNYPAGGLTATEPCMYCEDYGKLQADIERMAKQIDGQNKEIKRLEKWQIKPTEAICLTDLSCRYKKVFKND